VDGALSGIHKVFAVLQGRVWKGITGSACHFAVWLGGIALLV
jgi:hypothetical protein